MSRPVIPIFLIFFFPKCDHNHGKFFSLSRLKLGLVADNRDIAAHLPKNVRGVAMSDSFASKGTIVINAIAITVALAVISGHLPLNQFSLGHLQSLVPKIQTGQLFP
jgi:hypothetical protein